MTEGPNLQWGKKQIKSIKSVIPPEEKGRADEVHRYSLPRELAVA